jgi:signal peptidase I
MAARPRKVSEVSDPNERLFPRVDTPPERDESSDGAAPPQGETDTRRPPDWSPPAWPPPSSSSGLDESEHEFHHPLDRVTGNLPRRIRIAVDWIVTIVGAIAIVLAIKAWVINPYRIPSSSMEPTLHCARPATGCEARFSDRVLANRFIYHFRDPARGDVVVFNVPPEAKAKCGAGGTFVKRIVGLPGEKLQIRLIKGAGYVYVNGQKLDEPYIQQSRRDIGPEKTYNVPSSRYFVMGDNRSQSCDSRVWGAVPRQNIIGKVFMTYWPPQRISFR